VPAETRQALGELRVDPAVPWIATTVPPQQPASLARRQESFWMYRSSVA
jgi:hypothetical protein